MIRFLTYSEIDFEKYEARLNSSAQKKYSAGKFFLDIVANKQWSLLVLDDYEAVMPIFFVKKIGVKIVLMPKLCQQLGVFSAIDQPEINELFLRYLQDNFLVSYYAFNDCNRFKTRLHYRKNYIIPKNTYERVYENYSPKRKKKIITARALPASVVKLSFAEVRDFISENFPMKARGKEKREFLDFFKNISDAGMLDFFAFSFEDRIINLVGIYDDKETAVLLLNVNDRDFIKKSGSSVLIDSVLNNCISTRCFDFEGSSIPAVEEFFRGFRPVLKCYHIVQNSKKEILKMLFKIKR